MPSISSALPLIFVSVFTGPAGGLAPLPTTPPAGWLRCVFLIDVYLFAVASH